MTRDVGSFLSYAGAPGVGGPPAGGAGAGGGATMPAPKVATPAANPQHAVAAKMMLPTLNLRSQVLPRGKAIADSIPELHSHIEQQPHLAEWLAHHSAGTANPYTGEHGTITLDQTQALHHLLSESAHYPHLLDLFHNKEMTPEDLPGEAERHEENVDRLRSSTLPDVGKFRAWMRSQADRGQSTPVLPLKPQQGEYPPETGHRIYLRGPDGALETTAKVTLDDNADGCAVPPLIVSDEPSALIRAMTCVTPAATVARNQPSCVSATTPM